MKGNERTTRRRMLGAIAGLGAMAAMPATAWAQPRAGLAGRVETPELVLPGGRRAKATMLLPARLPAPALVLVHDRWGANDAIYDRAEAVIADRYIALMIDYMDGAEPKDEAGADAARRAVNRADALDIVAGWINWMLADARGSALVAAIGWGLGGGLAIEASMRAPLRGLSLFYPDEARRTADYTRVCPLQAHFPKAQGLEAAEMESALARYRRSDKVFSYDAGADFAAAGRPGYDRAEAALAWNRTIAFMRANLGKPPV